MGPGRDRGRYDKLSEHVCALAFSLQSSVNLICEACGGPKDRAARARAWLRKLGRLRRRWRRRRLACVAHASPASSWLFSRLASPLLRLVVVVVVVAFAIVSAGGWWWCWLLVMDFGDGDDDFGDGNGDGFW